MKYVLMDTNIYLDMLVDRRNNVSSNLVSNFKKLLDFDEIKLVVPKIVVHEVNKHLKEQLFSVGKTIEQAISSVEKIHDICGLSSETFDSKHHKKEARKHLTTLKERFRINNDEYLASLVSLINSIFEHKNCIIIEDDEKIRSQCLKRKIYKKAPFHIEGKESFADGTIAVTLIHLNDYVDLSSDDNIIFVTGNTSDFSNKDAKNMLHKDIVEDLILSNLNQYITYIISFNELVGKVLKPEVENANLKEEFEKDLEKEEEMKRDLELSEYLDYKRESAGLSSLDGFDDMFIDEFSNSSFVSEILTIFERINTCYDELEELYDFYDEELINYICSFELVNINQFISQWNSLANKIDFPETEANIGGLVEIIEYINKKSLQFDFSDQNKHLPDFISYGENKSFFALNKKEYTFYMEELFLSCQEGDVDYLELALIEDNKEKIATGNIEITYGYVNYNYDGNIDDSCDQSIVYSTTEIEETLSRIANDFEEWIIKEKLLVKVIKEGLNIVS